VTEGPIPRILRPDERFSIHPADRRKAQTSRHIPLEDDRSEGEKSRPFDSKSGILATVRVGTTLCGPLPVDEADGIVTISVHYRRGELTRVNYQSWPKLVEELKSEGNWPYESEEVRNAIYQEWQVRAREFFRQDEAPIIKELMEIGISVESVWDLHGRGALPLEVVKILISHLHQPHHSRVRDGIARAVANPNSQIFWGELLAVYQSEKDEMARDGLAGALASCAGKDHFLELIALAKDPNNGASRIIFVYFLRRSKAAEAWTAIEDLATDPQVGKYATELLAKREKKMQKMRQKLL
jgi:hypothetical protein